MPNTLHLMPIQFHSGLGDTSVQLTSYEKKDVTVQLEVDASAAQLLLPTWTGKNGKTYGYRPLPMGPTGKPLLFINYTQERKVDYMAGEGYNELEFYLSSEFVGENEWDFRGEMYDGAYGMFGVLLMPSDLIPLLVGREVLGTPKHMADVSDLVLEKIFADDKGQSGWFEVRNRQGGAFVAGGLRNVNHIPYEALNEPMPEHIPLADSEGWGQAKKFEPGFKCMFWKHIPGVNWVQSSPDVSYNLASTLEGELGELSQPMAGDGNIVFPCELDSTAHPNLSSTLSAIKNLVENHSNTFPGNVLIRHYSNAYRAQDTHIMDGPQLPRA